LPSNSTTTSVLSTTSSPTTDGFVTTWKTSSFSDLSSSFTTTASFTTPSSVLTYLPSNSTTTSVLSTTSSPTTDSFVTTWKTSSFSDLSSSFTTTSSSTTPSSVLTYLPLNSTTTTISPLRNVPTTTNSVTTLELSTSSWPCYSFNNTNTSEPTTDNQSHSNVTTPKDAESNLSFNAASISTTLGLTAFSGTLLVILLHIFFKQVKKKLTILIFLSNFCLFFQKKRLRKNLQTAKRRESLLKQKIFRYENEIFWLKKKNRNLVSSVQKLTLKNKHLNVQINHLTNPNILDLSVCQKTLSHCNRFSSGVPGLFQFEHELKVFDQRMKMLNSNVKSRLNLIENTVEQTVAKIENTITDTTL